MNDATNFFGQHVSTTVARRCDGYPMPNGGGGIQSSCFGLSLDGGFGFPVLREVCETLMVGTAAGHYRAVIEVNGI